MQKRTYNNTKRQQSSQATREAIIRAMVDAMSSGHGGVSVSEIAAASGVGVRTVYAHFPNTESRIRAINDWIDAKVDIAQVLPRSFEDLPDYAERLVDYVIDNEPMIRAQMSPGLPNDVRAQRKKPHLAALTKILVATGWSVSAAKQLAGFLIATMRAEAIFDLRDTYRLNNKQIKRSFRQMVEYMISDPMRAASGASRTKGNTLYEAGRG